MRPLWQRYAARFWASVPGTDALILRPPLTAPDDDLAFARQLYHRHRAYLLSVLIWQAEWQALGAAALLALLLNLLFGAIWISIGVLLTVAIATALIYFTPLLVARGAKLAQGRISTADDTAKGLVRRLLLRAIPERTPPDLQDPWRHGWISADGRPMAAEIAETDLRATDAAHRARSVLCLILAVSLVPLAATPFGTLALMGLLVVAFFRLTADPSPAAMRAKLLDAAASHNAEAAAWASAGASKWAAQAEAARTAQIAEAIRDKSKLLELGAALGILAARGDALAPSAGMPVGLTLRDLMQHLLVTGGTGAGKTAGVLRPLCKQLGKLPDTGIIVMDGKGSLPHEVAAHVPGLTIIDPASVSVSLTEGLRPSEIAATLSELLGSTEGRDRFFDTSAAALLRFAGVLAALEGGASYSLAGIWQIARDGPSAALLERINPADPEQDEAATFFGTEWPAMEAKTRASIIATLRAWYTTITGHPDLLKWARTAPGQGADITAPLTGGRIGPLAPAHRYGQAGRVAMALVKARLFAAIRDRADHGMAGGATPVVLIVDEAQEIAVKDDAVMLGVARSLELAIVAATQTVEGIESQLGEKDAARYLTLFGSMVALQNRSPKTAELIAGRIGKSFRPVLDTIPGVPTVRGAAWAQQGAGRLAAAATQPLIAASIEIGEGGRWQDLFAAINPFRLFGRTLAGEQDRPVSKLTLAPLVEADELPELTVEPNTALAVLTRARVPRRDIVRLEPLH